MEDKITLDKAAFKALASETRVSLLKKLGSRRATPSELAASLGISAQAASEHLAQLDKAGLVKREDEGRKWVYYSLTEKGRAVVQPSESRKIWVLLGAGILALAVAGFSRFFLQPGAQTAALGGAAPPAAPAATATPIAFGEKAVAAAAAEAGAASPSPVVEAASAARAAGGACANCGALTLLEIVWLAAGCLLVAAAACYYLKSKRRAK